MKKNKLILVIAILICILNACSQSVDSTPAVETHTKSNEEIWIDSVSNKIYKTESGAPLVFMHNGNILGTGYNEYIYYLMMYSPAPNRAVYTFSELCFAGVTLVNNKIYIDGAGSIDEIDWDSRAGEFIYQGTN